MWVAIYYFIIDLVFCCLFSFQSIMWGGVVVVCSFRFDMNSNLFFFWIRVLQSFWTLFLIDFSFFFMYLFKIFFLFYQLQFYTSHHTTHHTHTTVKFNTNKINQTLFFSVYTLLQFCRLHPTGVRSKFSFSWIMRLKCNSLI